MNNRQAFLCLLKAGLWGKREHSLYESVDYSKVLCLAEKQSVVGLVSAGMDYYDSVPQINRLVFLGKSMLIEQRNVTMNKFVANLVDKMQVEGIMAMIVKGQGVAQCYEKPLWRLAGDIDFLLDANNYERAKALLCPVADKVEIENKKAKHLGLEFRDVTVELHGRMPFSLSHRVDCVIDTIIKDIFEKEKYRVWENGVIECYLPDPDDDVILVFTHYLHHFFIEGVGLKQICDWCRVLWTFREEIDRPLLESRMRAMGLMSEWKAFASFAVDSLGMPVDAMPFYDEGFKRKGEMVLRHILKTGNFGQNNDLSYRMKYKGCAYKMVSFCRRLVDFVNFVPIFPLDAPRFFVTYVFSKVK